MSSSDLLWFQILIKKKPLKHYQCQKFEHEQRTSLLKMRMLVNGGLTIFKINSNVTWFLFSVCFRSSFCYSAVPRILWYASKVHLYLSHWTTGNVFTHFIYSFVPLAIGFTRLISNGWSIDWMIVYCCKSPLKYFIHSI